MAEIIRKIGLVDLEPERIDPQLLPFVCLSGIGWSVYMAEKIVVKLGDSVCKVNPGYIVEGWSFLNTCSEDQLDRVASGVARLNFPFLISALNTSNIVFLLNMKNENILKKVLYLGMNPTPIAKTVKEYLITKRLPKYINSKI